MTEAAKRLTAPFFWHDPEAQATQRIRGGTMCFVNTGRALIGVTAAHVQRGYEARMAASPESWCQIGGHTFDPSDRLLDIDDHLDLATYRLSELQVNAAGADIHHPQEWPPAARDGDICVVGGWPWSLASEGRNEATHQFLHFITQVSDASSANLGLALWTATSVPWGDSALPPGTNLGGMSGGPVFRLPTTGLAILELVGFIHEYHQGVELILARPAAMISADGTLNRR